MNRNQARAMATTIKQPFRTRAIDLADLFADVDVLSTFKRKLEAQAIEQDPDNVDATTIDHSNYSRNSYVGDGFEFFVEILLKLFENDGRVGVHEYQPELSLDTGVDGFGVNKLNEPSVVQVKYRSNSNQFLTANKDHLSNMVSAAVFRYRILPDYENKTNYRFYIFTTAEGLHYFTHGEMYKGYVKCFGNEDIRDLVDNNIVFWNNARLVVEEIYNLYY